MYWYLQLAIQLDDAPWPATKNELLDYAERNGLDLQVIENLRELEDEGYVYQNMSEIWEEYSEWDQNQNNDD